MKIYAVGGAVRDRLLDRPITERDWVVVGGTPEALLAQGYQQVGAAFPVFLHPETKEEYALARTEKKVGAGYKGFDFDFTPDVTLEADLERRDLTINAMAQTETGEIIDPYGGQHDLKERVLRHVSAAFVEDPLRVLRVARFMAQLSAYQFSIAPETLVLMQQIAVSGELEALTPERVWTELHKALCTDNPAIFIQSLRQANALSILLPELDALYGVPQPAQHHPEIDTGVHVEMVLTQAARLTTDPIVRFAAMVHDVGKGSTPQANWPKHHGHEARGIPLVKALCDRLKVPKAYRQVALDVTRFHGVVVRVDELRPDTVLKVLSGIDAFRQPARFERFLLACEADSSGRIGFEDKPYAHGPKWRHLFESAQQVDVQAVIQESMDGVARQVAVQDARLAAIKRRLKDYDRP